MDPAFGHSSAQVAEWLQRLPPDEAEIIATLVRVQDRHVRRRQ